MRHPERPELLDRRGLHLRNLSAETDFRRPLAEPDFQRSRHVSERARDIKRGNIELFRRRRKMPVRLQAERNRGLPRSFGRSNAIVDPQRKTEAVFRIADFTGDRNNSPAELQPRIVDDEGAFCKVIMRIDGACREGLGFAANPKRAVAHAEGNVQARLLPLRGPPGDNVDAGLDVQALMKIAVGIVFFQERADIETVDAGLEAVDHTARAGGFERHAGNFTVKQRFAIKRIAALLIRRQRQFAHFYGARLAEFAGRQVNRNAGDIDLLGSAAQESLGELVELSEGILQLLRHGVELDAGEIEPVTLGQKRGIELHPVSFEALHRDTAGQKRKRIERHADRPRPAQMLAGFLLNDIHVLSHQRKAQPGGKPDRRRTDPRAVVWTERLFQRLLRLAGKRRIDRSGLDGKNDAADGEEGQHEKRRENLDEGSHHGARRGAMNDDGIFGLRRRKIMQRNDITPAELDLFTPDFSHTPLFALE
ncbi:hypothetical protein D3C71_902300 [compost metagenome]